MRASTALVVALLSIAPLAAATPPDQINYQGVLRDGAGNPANGSFEMVFRLYDQQVGGTLVLSDFHDLAAGGAPVNVANGLFSVEIGSGGIVPGTFSTLSTAFGALGSLWLEIQVNAETLAPRLHFASAGYALNAGTLAGQAAGSFVNTSSQLQTKSGTLLVGTAGSGPFASLNDTGYGVIAKGSAAAGDFRESDSTAKAELAKGGVGITASGPTYGAYFGKPDFSGFAYLGNAATGIQAYGAATGGQFRNTVNGASADLAASSVYVPGLGWIDLPLGIDAQGVVGGVFTATDGGSSAWLAEGFGINAHGIDGGARFYDEDSSTLADVARDTYKIVGSGSVAFVQNHPTDKDRVIVYNAPEGDEVATYTRGSGRLVGGEARIALGETFAWVTNPDLGLTAYVTPVGEWADLYVASQSTTELVVRGRDPESADAAFNYIVYGLRIGFEETSIVQEKREEAFIPSFADHRKRYLDHPELRRYNALERVKGMRTEMGLETTPNLSASTALRNAIHEYDPSVDPPIELLGSERLPRGRGHAGTNASALVAMPPARGSRVSATGVPMVPRPAEPRSMAPASAPGGDPDATSHPALAPVETLRVSEPVHAGELLAIDPLAPESVRRADGVGDPRFVGIAAQDSERDQVVLATTRIVRVQADATFGAIAPGDLLTTSPSAGLAMRAADAPPGAVFGKALDPLATGTGEIRVLWMPQ
jgi:hypothetical protein